MIYITIPVHNEECTIGVLLWKIRKVMAAFGRDYRILVLDDASTDATAEVLERYASLLPLEVDRVSERIGQGAATARLLERAVGASDYPKRDIAVTIQADFTEDPVVIEPLVKAIEGGADLVAGALDPLSLTRQRRTGRWLAGMLLGKAGRDAPVSDPFSSLRAYRLVVVRKALREGSEAAELLSSDG